MNILLSQLKHNTCYAILEDRPDKYMFGTNNYGEITNTINKADNDPWDIIVPGYEKLKRNEPYKIKQIEGIILMPNNNHKVIIDIYTNNKRKSKKEQIDEIYTYRRLYNKICKKRGNVKLFDKFISFEY